MCCRSFFVVPSKVPSGVDSPPACREIGRPWRRWTANCGPCVIVLAGMCGSWADYCTAFWCRLRQCVVNLLKVNPFCGRLPLLLPLCVDAIMDEYLLPCEQWMEEVCLAWSCGVFGQSIHCVIPWAVTVSWYLLKAEHHSPCLNFCSRLQDGMDDLLPRFVVRVLNGL